MEECAQARTRGLTGNTLKIIAIIIMLIDHVGAVVIEGGIFGYPDMERLSATLAQDWILPYYMADIVLRTVGRVAFPIFCFLLVEGFCHTRDVKKYASRLFLFCLISEIPFDFALFGVPFYWGYQNVFFTLFIGVAVLYGFERFKGMAYYRAGVVIAGCLTAELLKTDYGMIGIVMILVLYVFRNDKKKQTIWGGLLAAVESLANFGTAILAFIPIRMYNGQKGKGGMKYFFYIFYPAHLLILGVIRMLLLRG